MNRSLGTGRVTSISSGYIDGAKFVKDGKYYIEIQLDENPGAVLLRQVEISVTENPHPKKVKEGTKK